ncbi:MAG: RagB/SusD family nutrient uptake outer membrane protein [Flavobacteriaceae bacterium]|jgi:hypothetical protein|nr:RagB/SusD family nutrient uptake outer membrane protein [Flavobacteriaceae bacterium]
MKIKFVKYIALAAVLTLGACSSDYLDTEATDAVNPDKIYKTTEGLKNAVNGLAKIMVTQHIGSQGFNGEGTIKMYYGEYMGNNFRVDLPGWSNLINGQFYNDVNSKYGYYPWHYYYMIISNANVIIDRADFAEGSEDAKNYYKAQALGYRAYAYTMLSQLYGQRWKDAQGADRSLVLRLRENDPSTMGLSTTKEVLDQVYKDLDQAIVLFEGMSEKGKSTLARKVDENYMIDISVVKAIYARVALVKQDYETAKKYAVEARAKFPLMSNDAYKAGFANPTGEWIWSSYGASDEQLFFFSYQAFIAYNSSASAVRVYPKRISKELFNQIPSSDIRKGMFLDPAKYDGQYNVDNGAVILKDGKGQQMDSETRFAWPELKSNALVAAYMQFKIKANDMPGVGHTNHFRSAEMYLIEAEAEHFLGNDAKAASLLEELNKQRDAKYSCNATGEAMFNEIVKYRGIELFGEGFDWFDMKRWKKDIVRKTGKEGGNYPVDLGVTVKATENSNWTWKTPAREVDYRTLGELPKDY